MCDTRGESLVSESDFQISETIEQPFSFVRSDNQVIELIKINYLGHSDNASLESLINLVAYGPYLGPTRNGLYRFDQSKIVFLYIIIVFYRFVIIKVKLLFSGTTLTSSAHTLQN